MKQMALLTMTQTGINDIFYYDSYNWEQYVKTIEWQRFWYKEETEHYLEVFHIMRDNVKFCFNIPTSFFKSCHIFVVFSNRKLSARFWTIGRYTIWFICYCWSYPKRGKASCLEYAYKNIMDWNRVLENSEESLNKRLKTNTSDIVLKR